MQSQSKSRTSLWWAGKIFWFVTGPLCMCVSDQKGLSSCQLASGVASTFRKNKRTFCNASFNFFCKLKNSVMWYFNLIMQNAKQELREKIAAILKSVERGARRWLRSQPPLSFDEEMQKTEASTGLWLCWGIPKIWRQSNFWLFFTSSLEIGFWMALAYLQNTKLLSEA